MAGLKKLSVDHLSHPNPHALTVWLHYSHPPIGQRLAALEG
jgi:STE24 endopeptidase